jgi:hypothetical protein
MRQYPECSQDSNGDLKFRNPFDEDYPGGEPIVLTFSKVILLNSQRPVTKLGIQTRQNKDGSDYLVDELDPAKSDTEYFTPNSVLFLYNSVETGSYSTF